jgi:hypothetical protein
MTAAFNSCDARWGQGTLRFGVPNEALEPMKIGGRKAREFPARIAQARRPSPRRERHPATEMSRLIPYGGAGRSGASMG